LEPRRSAPALPPLIDIISTPQAISSGFRAFLRTTGSKLFSPTNWRCPSPLGTVNSSESEAGSRPTLAPDPPEPRDWVPLHLRPICGRVGTTLAELQIDPNKRRRIRRSGGLLNYRLPVPRRVGGAARTFKAEMQANTTRKSKTAATFTSFRGSPSSHPTRKDVWSGHLLRSNIRHHTDYKGYERVVRIG
jgi:hypothetical protein